MNFQLIANKVESLEIKTLTVDETVKNMFSFTNKCMYSKESADEFMISFDFQLTSTSRFSVLLKHNFIFKCSEPVPEEFLNSHYTTVNAPAIAYPYLRAFVSTMLLNAGLESVNLPAINFVEHAKKNNQQQENNQQ